MERSTYAAPPHKYEAGTPPITQAVGLGAAVDYLTDLGMDAIHEHEVALTGYLLDGLSSVPGLRIIGPPTNEARGGAVSFVLEGIHPHDVGQLLDESGVAVRVGHHCARPACLRFGIPATTRASLHLYSDTSDVDALITGLDKVRSFFG
jgi:cysteine desulfurase/selenocysteine lyase